MTGVTGRDLSRSLCVWSPGRAGRYCVRVGGCPGYRHVTSDPAAAAGRSRHAAVLTSAAPLRVTLPHLTPDLSGRRVLRQQSGKDAAASFRDSSPVPGNFPM